MNFNLISTLLLISNPVKIQFVNSQDYDYYDALIKSTSFFQAMQSGYLSDEVKQNLPWRGNSAVNDGSDNGLNLSGGYYVDGDGYVKSNFPMAFSATVLAWSVIRYERTGCGGGLGVSKYIFSFFLISFLISFYSINST